MHACYARCNDAAVLGTMCKYSTACRGDTRAVNERMAAVPWQNITALPEFCDSFVAPSSLRLQCRPVPGDSIPYTSVDHIAIFHYLTQSKEDFPNKVHHFAADGETEEESWLFFDNFQKYAASSLRVFWPCVHGICSAVAHPQIMASHMP